MIDPQLLKTNVELIEENLKKRDLKINLGKLKNLDEDRRALKFESEKLRSEQKKLGKEIATSNGDEKNKLLKKAERLSEQLKQLSDDNQKKPKIRKDIMSVHPEYSKVSLRKGLRPDWWFLFEKEVPVCKSA